MKKTGLNGYVYDFSTDYKTVDLRDLVDIHKYLVRKNYIKYCSNLLKNLLLRY